MVNIPKILRATALGIGLALLSWGQRPPEVMELAERFQATASVLKGGKRIPVKASLKQITIRGRQHISQLPSAGFLLVQLRGGRVTAVINGQEQKHVAGDFWVVAANVKMSLDATGETATLDVISLTIP